MRALIQRITKAHVEINEKNTASVKQGILIFLGIEDSDTVVDIEWLAGKVARLRIFDDDTGIMNRSVIEINGTILVVSQFTLHASTKKGNRPSYIRAAGTDFARMMYERFIYEIREISRLEVQTGEFAADMKVSLINDGPVTIMIDTKNKE